MSIIRATLALIGVGYALSVAVYWFAGLHSLPDMVACDFVPWFAVRHDDWKPL